MPGLKRPQLTSRDQIRERDYRPTPSTVAALAALEQCLVTLTKITQNQKNWFAYQSYYELRERITKQVNMLTSIICKTLPADSLFYFSDTIDCAQRIVLKAYLCSVEKGKERTFLQEELTSLNLQGKNWGELIASIQSINRWPNRALPFVEGLLSSLDVSTFVPKPIVPSKWFILKTQVKSFQHRSIAFCISCGNTIKSWSQFVAKKIKIGLHEANVVLKQCGKSVKNSWQKMQSKIQKWREKPIPPIMTPDGYYVAPPIPDEARSHALSFGLFFSEIKQKIKAGANHIDEAIHHLTDSPSEEEISTWREPGRIHDCHPSSYD